jgi:hypothetical protein
MRRFDTNVTKATARERKIVARLSSSSAFGRVDRGEAEIVSGVDWSDVPILPSENTMVIPRTVFRALEAASRRRHTTPRRLALRLLRQGLLEKKTG